MKPYKRMPEISTGHHNTESAARHEEVIRYLERPYAVKRRTR